MVASPNESANIVEDILTSDEPSMHVTINSNVEEFSAEPLITEDTDVLDIDIERPISHIIELNNYDQQEAIDNLGEFRYKMKILLAWIKYVVTHKRKDTSSRQ